MSDDPFFEDVFTFEDETESILVAVQSYFLPEQSDVATNRYLWAYRVRIRNNSDQAVKLLNRHWIITDGQGKVEQVKGVGVIGEQPLVSPGHSYTYTSGCPLGTPSGFMHGSYEMIDEENRVFSVAIPAFSLDSPYCSQNIN